MRDWDDDEVLLGELRAVMMQPPVPQRVVEAAYYRRSGDIYTFVRI